MWGILKRYTLNTEKPITIELLTSNIFQPTSRSLLVELLTDMGSFKSNNLRFFVVVLHENSLAPPFSDVVLHQVQSYTYVYFNK